MKQIKFFGKNFCKEMIDFGYFEEVFKFRYISETFYIISFIFLQTFINIYHNKLFFSIFDAFYFEVSR